MKSVVKFANEREIPIILETPIDDVRGCLSFGLGAEWSFEKNLLEMSGGKVTPGRVVFFDASISIIGLIKSIGYMARRTFYELRIRRPESERKFKLEDLKRAFIAVVMYLSPFYLLLFGDLKA